MSCCERDAGELGIPGDLRRIDATLGGDKMELAVFVEVRGDDCVDAYNCWDLAIAALSACEPGDPGLELNEEV
jgi:hypothetical protein